MNGRFSERSLGRALTGIVFLYQGLAAVALVLSLALALQWIREPFLGAFYEHTLIFTDVGAGGESWAFNNVVHSGDQLLAVNGAEVKTSRDARDAIAGKFAPGENVTLTVEFANGETRDLSVELQQFPDDGVSAYLLLPFGIGVIFFALGVWTYEWPQNQKRGKQLCRSRYQHEWRLCRKKWWRQLKEAPAISVRSQAHQPRKTPVLHHLLRL